MKITGIIPARYASTRFPGKPLIDIKGKTMIQRVYEQCLKASRLNELFVATDDERIFTHVKSFGGRAILTAGTHINGTNRCAEVAETLISDVVINIQGDEPFIEPEQIDLLCTCFEQPKTQIATLIKLHVNDAELKNPARIKVVVNTNMEALYFSRSVIPHHRDLNAPVTYYKHIGIYGYRRDVLLQIAKLSPTPLELAESLEQLRWLEHGFKIKCAITPHDSHSIDVPEDLANLTI